MPWLLLKGIFFVQSPASGSGIADAQAATATVDHAINLLREGIVGCSEMGNEFPKLLLKSPSFGDEPSLNLKRGEQERVHIQQKALDAVVSRSISVSDLTRCTNPSY